MSVIKSGDKVLIGEDCICTVLGNANGYKPNEKKTFTIESDMGLLATFSEEFLIGKLILPVDDRLK